MPLPRFCNQRAERALLQIADSNPRQSPDELVPGETLSLLPKINVISIGRTPVF
jgi:hypothetical protein